ncbi:MAG: 23S rRNA (adenine(2503)-C(2))-methyltransferase RlmN [Planctomycetes bacterium]|nr:23S rRNA (adenine(2503)-C(2))-methyltransferase RlmN [Planctomycetota bacterium]
MSTPSLIGMTQDTLRDAVVAAGGKPFNARQLAQWLYEKREPELARMTNLPKNLREQLAASHATLTSSVLTAEDSGEGTTKLALKLHDGPIIECVLMREENEDGSLRLTACISTQAGCAMGCRFCASGMLGLKRNLTAGEILEQLYHIDALLKLDASMPWLTNVVVMGMGEPLHNFDNLMQALNILNADWGFRFGARRITVSTVGLPDRIRELAKQGMQFNLAISLHATTDEQRTKLIPTNVATGLINIIQAAADYFKETKREVTFEYTLVGGQNDSAADAGRLAELLRGFPRANVNLIPMNPVEGSGLIAPTTQAVEEFTRILRQAAINVHVRKKRGRAVQAACGQLRLRLEGAST